MAFRALRRPATGPRPPAGGREAGAGDDGVGHDGADRVGTWFPVVVAALFGALYAAYALALHRRLRTSAFDLGIFEQAIRAYADHRAPIVPLKGPGFNLLGDHFHPILVLLAPVYRILPAASTLLVAQAALIAASIVPVARLAVARLGARSGAAVTVAYGLSFGLQGAVGFDFHEIAFAVPLLAFAMVALAERRWTAAVAWTVPLLLVKEDMGLTVAAIGGYLLWRGRRGSGAALVVAGLAAVALTTAVLLPMINPAGYDYALYLGSGGSTGGRHGLVGQVLRLPNGMVEHPRRLVLLCVLAMLTAGAALRSPLALICLPALLSRLVSDNPWHWEVGRVHYNAILMPIVFVAFLDAWPILAASRRPAVRRFARAVVPLTVGFALFSQLAPGSMTHPSVYGDDPRAAAVRRLLRMVPDGGVVAAGNNLAPRLTARCTVVIFPIMHGERPEWVVVDTTLRDADLFVPGRDRAAALGLWPPAPARQRAAVAELPRLGFVQVAAESGVLLFRRQSVRPG